MDSNKLKEIFKIQTINFINDLLLVFNNDNLIKNIKEKIILQLEDNNFFNNLNIYFSKNIENGINTKNIELLLNNNKYLLPISGENIVKIKLQSYWLKLDNNNREKVWLYLDILLNIYRKI
tara:strand:- start:2527 stop:2889 length:363 start_codon:yes stop_codon:yes gene_type:complete